MMTLMLLIVPVLSVVSNLSIYGYALGMDVNIKVIVVFLMGGIFILLGNYMSKNHQNYRWNKLHGPERWKFGIVRIEWQENYGFWQDWYFGEVYFLKTTRYQL